MKQRQCYNCIISVTSVRHWYIKTVANNTVATNYCLSAPYTTRTAMVTATSSENNNKKTVWERQAKSIKNTDFENSKYLDTLRLTHDPSLHIKTIEDELKGTIGSALGRQGEKILFAVRNMDKERLLYQELLLESSSGDHKKKIKECIDRHNEHRRLAIKARWELLVHRQAAGFIVRNNEYVMKHYPIADELIEPSSEQQQDDESHIPTTTKRRKEEVKSNLQSKKDDINQNRSKISRSGWWQSIMDP